MFRCVQLVVLTSLLSVTTGGQWSCRETGWPTQVKKDVTLHCNSSSSSSSSSITILDSMHSTEVDMSVKQNIGQIRELALKDCLGTELSAQRVLDSLGIRHVMYLVVRGVTDTWGGGRGVLADLTTVDDVSLKGLGLAEVPAEAFGQSPLHNLDLRHNNLTELSEGVFSGLTCLRGLFLSHNRLTHLPDGLLRDNTELVGLQLDNNHLYQVSSTLFEPLQRLRILNLSNNRLSHIGSDVWRLPALRGLYLSHNQLTSLPEQDQVQSALTHVDVSYNRLTRLYSDWTRLSKLRELRLSHNALHDVQMEKLEFQSPNVVLQLEHNNITEVTFSIPLPERCDPRAAIIVYLHGNPFTCDCRVRQFLRLPRGSGSSSYLDIPRPDRRLVFKGTNKMICSGPPHLQSRPLSDIREDELSCPGRARNISSTSVF